MSVGAVGSEDRVGVGILVGFAPGTVLVLIGVILFEGYTRV